MIDLFKVIKKFGGYMLYIFGWYSLLVVSISYILNVRLAKNNLELFVFTILSGPLIYFVASSLFGLK